MNIQTNRNDFHYDLMAAALRHIEENALEQPTLEKVAEAIGAYRRCLAIDPGYERARLSLAALLAVQGQEWDPKAESLHKRGLRLLVEGRLQEATEAFIAALDRQVRPETYLSLALTYERREAWRQALEAYGVLMQAGGRFAATARTRIDALQGRE